MRGDEGRQYPIPAKDSPVHEPDRIGNVKERIKLLYGEEAA